MSSRLAGRGLLKEYSTPVGKEKDSSKANKGIMQPQIRIPSREAEGQPGKKIKGRIALRCNKGQLLMRVVRNG